LRSRLQIVGRVGDMREEGLERVHFNFSLNSGRAVELFLLETVTGRLKRLLHPYIAVRVEQLSLQFARVGFELLGAGIVDLFFLYFKSVTY
jgi:hypothetical protein